MSLAQSLIKFVRVEMQGVYYTNMYICLSCILHCHSWGSISKDRFVDQRNLFGTFCLQFSFIDMKYRFSFYRKFVTVVDFALQDELINVLIYVAD